LSLPDPVLGPLRGEELAAASSGSSTGTALSPDITEMNARRSEDLLLGAREVEPLAALHPRRHGGSRVAVALLSL
jgi:hypothetical protein